MTRRGWMALVLGLAVLGFLLMGCDDWDGMDRSGWHTPTPTVSEYVPAVRMPEAWK